MLNSSFIPKLLRLLFLLISLELLGQLSLALIGVWKVATPWTGITVMYYGFYEEVLASLLVISLLSPPAYLAIFNPKHRKHANLVLAVILGALFCFILGFILFQVFHQESTPDFAELLKLVRTRTHEPRVWALFLSFEGTTFALASLGVIVLATDGFKSPKRVIRKTDFDKQHLVQPFLLIKSL
jgi:hypothetical protein